MYTIKVLPCKLFVIGCALVLVFTALITDALASSDSPGDDSISYQVAQPEFVNAFGILLFDSG